MFSLRREEALREESAHREEWARRRRSEGLASPLVATMRVLPDGIQVGDGVEGILEKRLVLAESLRCGLVCLRMRRMRTELRARDGDRHGFLYQRAEGGFSRPKIRLRSKTMNKKTPLPIWEVFGYDAEGREMRQYLEADSQDDAEIKARDRGLMYPSWSRCTEED